MFEPDDLHPRSHARTMLAFALTALATVAAAIALGAMAWLP